MIVTISLLVDRVEKCHQTIVKQSRGLQRNSLFSTAAEKTSSHYLKPTISEKRKIRNGNSNRLTTGISWFPQAFIEIVFGLSLFFFLLPSPNMQKNMQKKECTLTKPNSSITLIHWEAPSWEIPLASQQRLLSTTPRDTHLPPSQMKRIHLHREHKVLQNLEEHKCAFLSCPSDRCILPRYGQLDSNTLCRNSHTFR